MYIYILIGIACALYDGAYLLYNVANKNISAAIGAGVLFVLICLAGACFTVAMTSGG